jgi:hypothetical protein
MLPVRDELTHLSADTDSDLRPEMTLDPRSSPGPHLTVLGTTEEGTLAALRASSAIGQNLNARITLLKIETLPRHYPVDRCPAHADSLERSATQLVRESGLRPENVSVQVWLCRDEKKCLRRALDSHSVIMIGTKSRWWPTRERKLQKWLSKLGHYVIPVQVNAQNCTEMLPKSFSDSVLCHVAKNLHSSCWERDSSARVSEMPARSRPTSAP